MEISIFCTKNDQIFLEFPCILYPCDQKSAYFFFLFFFVFLEFPMKNVGNLGGFECLL